MGLARRMGLERVAWSLRRLHCPVGPQALVLEVGSGGNPYARANVLLDAYEATRQRHWAPLVADRPTLLGHVERLPFRDGAFDFVIASHVLEHSTRPEQFLAELQRVSRAGYIEVPDAFMERINPYRDHRLEVTCRDGRLVIRKKSGWQADPELVELYEHRVKRPLTRQLIPKHPFEFHVRYYWESHIDFEIVNPSQSCDWLPPAGDEATAKPAGHAGAGWRSAALALARSVLSQRRRNAHIQLLDLMRCIACGGVSLKQDAGAITCLDCSRQYEVRRGMPVMLPEEPR